jgi:hypothetical protein
MPYKKNIPRSQGINDVLTLGVEVAACAEPRIWEVTNESQWVRLLCDEHLVSSYQNDANTLRNLTHVVKGLGAATTIVQGLDLHNSKRRIISVATETTSRRCETCNRIKRKKQSRNAKAALKAAKRHKRHG